MSIDLRKYIHPSTVCIYNESLSKPLILEKIAEIASSNKENSEQLKLAIYEGLQAREMLGSTALNRGLALPHCRIPNISDFILGILVSPEGVVYGSLDGKLTRVFVFVIAPKESGNKYLDIMGEIGAFLSNDERVTKLADSKNNESLYLTFLQLWEEYIKENQ